MSVGKPARAIIPVMDWILPLYREYIARNFPPGAGGGEGRCEASGDRATFLRVLAESTATLYVMEPVGATIRFKGLGRWPLAEAPDLLADPNAFIADRFGGGKFKVNFHHGLTFVGTHNFRTHGEPLWPEAEELSFE